jgi:hypothetical protein
MDHFSLVVRHLLSSCNKQLHLSSLVGTLPWRFDVPTGTLSFGNDLHWHAQILGTESHETNTWLWAWANTGSNLPPALIQASLQMKWLSQEQNVPELTQPQLPLSQVINGHVLAMIASGICDADAYYRGPYEGGAAFLLIKDEKFPRSKEPPLARLAHVFPQAISAFVIPDHRLALTSYLDQHGIDYTSEGRTIVVKEGKNPVLTARFDEQNRVAKLDVALGG